MRAGQPLLKFNLAPLASQGFDPTEVPPPLDRVAILAKLLQEPQYKALYDKYTAVRRVVFYLCMCVCLCLCCLTRCTIRFVVRSHRRLNCQWIPPSSWYSSAPAPRCPPSIATVFLAIRLCDPRLSLVAKSLCSERHFC